MCKGREGRNKLEEQEESEYGWSLLSIVESGRV